MQKLLNAVKSEYLAVGNLYSHIALRARDVRVKINKHIQRKFGLIRLLSFKVDGLLLSLCIQSCPLNAPFISFGNVVYVVK